LHRVAVTTPVPTPIAGGISIGAIIVAVAIISVVMPPVWVPNPDIYARAGEVNSLSLGRVGGA
jgi:hypothetical protein